VSVLLVVVIYITPQWRACTLNDGELVIESSTQTLCSKHVSVKPKTLSFRIIEFAISTDDSLPRSYYWQPSAALYASYPCNLYFSVVELCVLKYKISHLHATSPRYSLTYYRYTCRNVGMAKLVTLLLGT